MYRGITFDVGSTLIYPDPSEDIMMQNALKQLGHEVPLEIITPYIDTMYNEVYVDELKNHPDFWADDNTSRDLWHALYRWLSTVLGFADIKDEVADIVYKGYLKPECWSLYDDALPVLQALREKGIHMGVISNWDGNLPILLEGIHIAEYFDTITTSALVNLRKPDPRIFDLTLNKLGLEPHEVLHIGDNVDADGFGAKEAGVKTLIVDRNHLYDGDDFTSISSLMEILNYI